MTTAKHALVLKTPLKDKFHVSQVKGHEELGRLFQFDLDVTSENPEIQIDDLLGQNVTLHLDVGGGETRHFNGIVSSFTLGDQIPNVGAVYHLTLRPWLWFLTQTADCRIFQEESVPGIIKKIFNDHGFPDVEDKLNESHKPWSYCVQYRETDFDFISRLMEEEGIYYYFTHDDGKHTLVLADSGSAHKKIRNDALKYSTRTAGNVGDIFHWSVHAEVQPGAFAYNDYDYKRPKASLRVRQQKQEKHAGSEYEIYDYPGEYAGRFEGTKGEYADIRIQQLHVPHTQAAGITSVKLMSTGGLFKLDKFPRKDQNKEYLVISTAYDIGQSLQPGTDPSFECQFRVIDSKIPFRPRRQTPKPVVQGPQTAVVIDAGPDPEGYGRVKVQFFWDRAGQDSGSKACWVRVAQNSAGSGWGSYFPPHIGNEVIVSFLEGDPDQPLVTGRVYNADNRPDKLWSGTIDNSVITDHVENKVNLDGADVPIICFTQKSNNQILMHNDKGIMIKDHYGNEIVMSAEEKSIFINRPNDAAESEPVGSTYEKINAAINKLIHGDQSQTFAAGSSIKLFKEGKEAHKRVIAGDEVIEVQGKRELKVYNPDLASSETLYGAHNEFIVGAESKVIGGAKSEVIVGAKHETVLGVIIEMNRLNKKFEIAEKHVKEVKEFDIHAKKEIKLNSADISEVELDANEIKLNSGKSSLTIKKDGDIVALTKTKIGVSGDQEVSITAKSGGIKMRAGSGGLKIKSQGEATINGQTIKLG